MNSYNELETYVRDVETRLKASGLHMRVTIYLNFKTYKALAPYHYSSGGFRDTMQFYGPVAVAWAPDIAEGGPPKIAVAGGDFWDLTERAALRVK